MFQEAIYAIRGILSDLDEELISAGANRGSHARSKGQARLMGYSR